MTDNDSNDSKQSSLDAGGDQGTAVNRTANAARRRFLKGTAVAAPLIMTVASRPVFGAVCTPSGWTSGNGSHPNDQCSAGYTPGGWKTPDSGAGDWSTTPYVPGGCESRNSDGTCKVMYTPTGGGTPTPFFSPGFSFTDYNGYYSANYRGLTMLEVLWLPQSMKNTGDPRNDPYEFGAHMTAALLNASSIPGYGLSVAQVQEIYKQVDTVGYYTTSNGFQLSAQDIVDFLKQTMV